MHILPLTLLLSLTAFASAQFQFFEQMFNQGGQQQQQQHHHQGQERQNVASDSEWYQKTYDSGKPTSFPIASLSHPPVWCLFRLSHLETPALATLREPPSYYPSLEILANTRTQQHIARTTSAPAL